MYKADWVICRLSAEDERPPFDSGEQDLNEFFAVDSIKSGRELLSVTYVVMDKNENAIAFFSLSNDSIRREADSIFRVARKKGIFPGSCSLLVCNN